MANWGKNAELEHAMRRGPGENKVGVMCLKKK